MKQTHKIDLEATTNKAAKGFHVIPWRWAVERTFSWLGQSRRLSKDYERLPETGEMLLYAAMSRLTLRRLAKRAH